MLKLKTLSTGSKGNCYLLSTADETLILDCGIGINDIKKGLNFDVSRIVGVCVTHSHLDHSLSVTNFENMGIDVWKPYEVPVENKLRKFGNFTVQAFAVPHDDVPCYGFYIKVDGQKLLYATDFEYIPFNFARLGINHMLLECNYQNKYIQRMAVNYDHVLRGHCELQTTLDVVKYNASDTLKNVILCHLSDKNAVPNECVLAVKKIAQNANVDYARKGFEIEL